MAEIADLKQNQTWNSPLYDISFTLHIKEKCVFFLQMSASQDNRHCR